MVPGNATEELSLHTIFPQNWIQDNTDTTAAGIWDACEARAIAAILLPLAMVGVRELMRRFGRLSKK